MDTEALVEDAETATSILLVIFNVVSLAVGSQQIFSTR